MSQEKNLNRCDWCTGSTIYQNYHDQEWGVPLFDDRRLFEFLILEGAQAGLSWITILKKREAYRQAYSGFDPVTIAGFGTREVAQLMLNPGIIRNRLKIESSIRNARAYLDVLEREASFSDYLWQQVDGVCIQNGWRSMAEVPAETQQSQNMSKRLKKDGFSFVGPTICYAFMQAIGMVNDHLVSCYRHEQLS